MNVSMNGMRNNLLNAYYNMVSNGLTDDSLEILRTAINSFMFVSIKDDPSFIDMSDSAIDGDCFD